MSAVLPPVRVSDVSARIDDANCATDDSLEPLVMLQDRQAGPLTREDALCLLVAQVNRQLNYHLHGPVDVMLEPQMSMRELSEYVQREGGRLGLCV